VKGLRTNPFSESLLRDKVETMAKVQRRTTTHIEAEEYLIGHSDIGRMNGVTFIRLKGMPSTVVIPY